MRQSVPKGGWSSAVGPKPVLEVLPSSLCTVDGEEGLEGLDEILMNYKEPPNGELQPRVLSRRNGEVRRMSSVLDLRMRGLACGLERERNRNGKPETRWEMENVDGDGSEGEECEVDMFGIPIPDKEDAQEGEEREDGQSNWIEVNGRNGVKTERTCCVVVCESVSKLDLSALLC